MIKIEVIILIIFIVIALVANYFLKKKRALRKAKQEQELRRQDLLKKEQKAKARKEQSSELQEPEVFGAHVPEDALLRRHYITHLRTLIVSLADPKPTDIALHRHYDTSIANELKKCLQEEKQAQQLIRNCGNLKKPSSEQPVQYQPSADAKPQIKPAVKTAPVKSVAPISGKEEKQSRCNIPQDSMLKRHFLSHLRSIIISQHAPRPAECVLRRHYDTMIDTELDKQVEEMSS